MESKRLFGKMNRPLDEYMGGMIVSDQVCLAAGSTSPVIRGNLPCLMKFPGKRFMTTGFLLEDLP